MRKKKVLFFVEAMGGGVFTYITDLANGLSESFDVYIAYTTRKQTPTNYKEYFNKNIHLIRVNNFTRQISICDIKAFFEIKRICKEVKPDIIHLHSAKAGVLGRWAFNGKNIPVFYTPHGYSFLMKNETSMKRRLYKLIEKISARKNAITIACSYGEFKETQKLTSNAVYINNGIDTEKIDKICAPFLPKENVVFTLGRISDQKNPTIFNEIAKHFPNTKFVWIGDGKLKSKLTSPNIEVTGWLNAESALKKAANYKIFLLTSEWEGLPMALLEAMYMKKICVVSNVIGNNNVIKNNINGYLCEGLDDYIQAIDNILKENIPEYITENAFDDVKNNYTSKIMENKYKNIYVNALSKKRNFK